MLEDVSYYVEPVDTKDSTLTSVHYVIIADSLRASNSSCGWPISVIKSLLMILFCYIVRNALRTIRSSWTEYRKGHNRKKVGKKLENLLDTSGSRMMLLPDLQSFCPRVTLTFDLLTPKVGGFTPLPVDYTCGN